MMGADVIKVLLCALAAAALPAAACEFPDEGGMPLRRAVTRIQLLPETDAWAREMHRDGVIVQYLVLLDEPVRQAGRCYWTVEVRAEGKPWRRFLITPDGKNILPKKQD